MTELLHNERNAYLFSNGNDVDFQVISWTDEELEEEKTPEKELSVDKDEKLKVENPKKKKKTKKKKKKASDEQKDVDNNDNNTNSLSATAKPFVPSTFAIKNPFPTSAPTNDNNTTKRKRNMNKTNVQLKSTVEPRNEKKRISRNNKEKSKLKNNNNNKMLLQPSQIKISTSSKKKSSDDASKPAVSVDPLNIMDRAISKVKGLPYYKLSENLTNIIGDGPMTRPDAISKVWKYIKENELEMKIEGRLMINCDDKLKKLFDLKNVKAGEHENHDDDNTNNDDKIQGFHVGKLLKPNFLEKVGYTNPKLKQNRSSSGEEDGTNNNSNNNNNNDKSNKKKKNNKKWWKSMTEVDPISLEPLGTLKYPPFEIIGKDGHKHFFDGQCLASYMVGTSSFFNPLSREPISSRVCQRLDIYLQKNKLKQLRVLEAFNLNKNVVGKDSNGSQSRQLQREAATVMSSVFSPRRHRSSNRGNSRGNGNNYQGNINNTTTNGRYNSNAGYAREREEVSYDTATGVRMFDDDSWVEASPINLQQDFPSLASGTGTSATSNNDGTTNQRNNNIANLNASNNTNSNGEDNTNKTVSTPTWGIKAGTGRVPFIQSQAEFPTFQSKPPSTTNVSANNNSIDSTKSSSDMWSRGISLKAAADLANQEMEAAKLSAPKRPERLKLKLKPKSKMPVNGNSINNNNDVNKKTSESNFSAAAASILKTTTATTKTSSIFGEARPREYLLKEQGRLENSNNNNNLLYDNDAISSLEQDGFLCPYSPWMLAMGRTMGQRWLLQIESSLRQFIHEGPGIKVLQPSLASMPIRQRAFIHEYCQNHWGFSTTSVDPEPKRHVRVFKSGEPHIPFLLLSRSVLAYGGDLGQGVDINDRPGGVNNTFKSDAGRIALLGIEGPGNQRVALEQVHGLFRSKSRRSEYTLNWICDDRNLIVEFATRMRARKCFQHLIDKHGRDGPVTWKKAQWWPAPISYAQHQLDLISRKQRARKVLERENRRKQFEMRKMEDKLRREHDEIRTRKKKVRDGWFDSDEEQPSASSSSYDSSGNDEEGGKRGDGYNYDAFNDDASDWEDEFNDSGDNDNVDFDDQNAVNMQLSRLEKEEALKRMRKLSNRTNKPMGIVRTTLMDHADENAWEALMSDDDDDEDEDDEEPENTTRGQQSNNNTNNRRRGGRKVGRGKYVPSFAINSSITSGSIDPMILYEEQLTLLQDMGMTDIDRIIAVLMDVDGDINLAIERLMG